MGGIRRRARGWSRFALALCGAYTAVLGYDNPSGSKVTVPRGASNKFTPTRYDGNQPTTFLPGRQRGVFSLTVDHPSVKWKLDSSTLRLDRNATRCPPSTEMPEQGNGTGIAVGLLAGGVLGVFLVRRMQRRLTAAAEATSSSSTQHTGPEADDA
jgi:hypothetical protein